MSTSTNLHWLYDEVEIRADSHEKTQFILTSPWLSLQFKVAEPDNLHVLESLEKLTSGNISRSDLEFINRMISGLVQYPIAYILPRNSKFGVDIHEIHGTQLNLRSPHELFSDIFSGKFSEFLKTNIKNAWTWDIDQALEFSKCLDGYDPLSLFTVVRRFHLLNDLESNQTSQLFEHIKSLAAQKDLFKKVSALVMRQNHYVTLKCEEVLSAALPTAQSADLKIKEFIKAESGHDKILAKAISSAGLKPEQIEVIEASTILMDLFKSIGQKNLLAFSAVVDVFERTSYYEEDPLTAVLSTGGLNEAGRLVDVHREINDSGDHENVAQEFLLDMKPVSEAYAREALRLAELNTLVIHQHSKELLRIIKNY